MQLKDTGKKKYFETKRLIRIAMAERQLVLFVGAGASVDAGLPLWDDAAARIKDKLNIDNDQQQLDNLAIPQYYYNARGQKEYTQLMRTIFRYDDKVYPTDIHDAIIRFGAETIITTNYDHLIEQSAEKNGQFLYVVSQDSDLPYRKAGKELIKMHGDFEHDNFVLKEDDYLHYHKNFKLIENYVKSLIGIKTVLFIGYSLNDPDVKHIFSWVKEILDGHFQRAYLILTGRKENQNEIDYYRHLGLNIIYPTELFGEDQIKFKDHSLQLLATLNYILDDEEKEKGIVDSLYENLKPFVSLNYTYKKYIERAFNRLRTKVDERITLRVEEDNYIAYSDISALEEEKEFLSELDSAIDGISKNQKVQSISEALRRSAVKGTRRETNKGKCLSYDRKEFFEKDIEYEWIDAIKDFNYKRLIELKEYNAKILSDRNPNLYLQQAYICSFLGDYLSAYYCLDNAANYFYRKREYSWYFISLWNKKNIARIIALDIRCNIGISQDIKDTIKKDYETTDLDKTLRSIPDLGNDNNQFLRDLKDFKFASDLFYDVVSNSVKANTQARERYYMFAGMPAYEKMRQLVYDYYRYGLLNCLMVDRYRENNEIYNLFVRSIFASVSAPDKDTSEEAIFRESGNIHADSLNAMDIHLILRYIDSHKLRKLFDEFNINIIEIDESGKEYLDSLFVNIPGLFSVNESQEKDIFWCFVCFLAHTNIDEKLASSAFDALIAIGEKEYYKNKRESLMELITAVYTQKLYNSKDLCERAKALINTLVSVVSEKKECLQYYRTSIVNLVSFCKKGENLYSDEASVNKILSDDYYSLLAEMYMDSAENVRALIDNVFDGWKCPDSLKGYSLYSTLVLNRIIEPDKVIEARALDFLVHLNEQKQKELKQRIRTFSAYNIENDLLNLYLLDLLLDVDKLKEIILKGDDKFSKWLVDVDNFDYNEFDLNWLKHCYPKLLKKLADNKRVRESVILVYKEKYSTEYIDNNTNEIIIKYFI